VRNREKHFTTLPAGAKSVKTFWGKFAQCVWYTRPFKYRVNNCTTDQHVVDTKI